MVMKLSREGAMELIGHEGIVLTRYKDSVGVWTLGVGHTKAAGAPDPATYSGELPLAEVFALFERDVGKYVAAVNAALKVAVTQTQFDALVSWHFNTGRVADASLIRRLNAGDVAGAGAGLLAWNKPSEVMGRRTKEHTLFVSGRYSNEGMASIFPADAAGRVIWSKPRRVDLRKALDAPVSAAPADAPAPQPPPPDIPAPKPAPEPPKPEEKGFWGKFTDLFRPRG